MGYICRRQPCSECSQWWYYNSYFFRSIQRQLIASSCKNIWWSGCAVYSHTAPGDTIVYTKEVRSILELALPVWHSGLTRVQTKDIERIQRISFRLILGPAYENYKQACEYLGTQTLEERRVKLCLKFARKNLKNDKCMFKKIIKNVKTRQSEKLVWDYKCRTSRYKKSSIPYLARLLNSNSKTKNL